jgi:hypothetical protein
MNILPLSCSGGFRLGCAPFAVEPADLRIMELLLLTLALGFGTTSLQQRMIFWNK